jgi:hypothetical protein
MTCRAAKRSLATFLVLACGLILPLAAARAAEPARADGWIRNDLTAAQNEARETGKPIFVVFRCEA